MKALLLLRHADSGDKLQGQTDHDRGLTNRGITQSALVATHMHEKGFQPEQVIASDATRVRATVVTMLKQLGYSANVSYLPELYEGDASTYLKVVRNAPDCQTLLIAGHNPAISAFASFISMTKVAGVGTANLLVFHFKEDSWSKLDKGECELMEHFAP